MKKNLDDVVDFFWFVLVLLILGFPRIMQVPKIALCLLIFSCSLISYKSFVIPLSLVKFLCPWIIYATITTFTGVIFNNLNVGIDAFVKVNFFNVLLYSVLISSVNRMETFSRVIQGSAFATIYISLYNILLTVCVLLRLDISLLLKLDATAGVSLHGGYTHLVTTNSSMLIMLFPLLLLMKRHCFIQKIINEKIYVIMLLLCAIAMVLSGRRILWISLAISLFAWMFLNSKDVLKLIKRMTIVVVVFIIALYIGNLYELFSFEGLIERFQYAFSNFDEYGQVNVRNLQSEYLLNGFYDKMFFGNGAGATISDFQRSSDQPWSFELSYHAVLFQSGIVGTLFYFISLMSIALCGILALRIDKIMGQSIFVSYLIVLVANASNPYFSSSFDFLFFLFMPLLLSEFVIAGKNNHKNNLFINDGAL